MSKRNTIYMAYNETTSWTTTTSCIHLHQEVNVNWVESGYKATKKDEKHINELSLSEAQQNKEADIHWVLGATNPADIFTKNSKYGAHYKGKQDNNIVKPYNSFFII